MMKAIKELRAGDLIDLEVSEYITQELYDGEGLEFEYTQVIELQPETDTCILVYFDGFAIGFPPEYMLKVEGHRCVYCGQATISDSDEDCPAKRD